MNLINITLTTAGKANLGKICRASHRISNSRLFAGNAVLMMLILLHVTGCVGKIFSEDSIFAPHPLKMGGPDKTKASPEYLQGWDDGCKTGLSTMVQGYYKSFYTFKQDPYMVSNATYYKAWKDAYGYCRQYSFRYSWDAYDRTYNKSLENPLCVICPNELERGQ